ncbi:MAG: lactate utilization protein [Haloarculaceae archaeon]
MPATKSDYLPEVDVDESLDERPDDETVQQTIENLRARGFDVVRVAAPDVLDELRDRIPDGASVMNGHSTTLEEVGFVEYLEDGDHDWENLHEWVRGADDDAERARRRREALTADYFLGGVNAVAESGELVAADASGSRVGAYPFAAANLLLVTGTNKIVPDTEAARDRLESVAYPLEDARAQDAYGQGSVVGTQLVYRHEVEDGRTTVVLVEDSLGF